VDHHGHRAGERRHDDRLHHLGDRDVNGVRTLQAILGRRHGGGEVKPMKDRLSGAAPLVAVVAVALASAILAFAITAPPASAFGTWAHDGAQGCSCHDQGTPTDATCTACHTGFQSYPGMTCWSCHAPGQDTSSLSSPSSACSQECHLWDPIQKQYVTSFSHGTNPHLGSTSECLDCHSTSTSIADPGSSPHHSGQATGFTDCGACHSSLQKHDGKVACTKCHKTAQAFHLYQANSPGYVKCGSCHKMRHDGRRIAQSKCATCHKGTKGRAAQHSTAITKKYVCSTCHKQKLHARAVSKKVKSCRTCHKGKYHAKQRTPARSVCTKCHSRALHHANGYACWLCHRPAVHSTHPRAVNVKK
jgi:hypothetical protein